MGGGREGEREREIIASAMALTSAILFNNLEFSDLNIIIK